MGGQRPARVRQDSPGDAPAANRRASTGFGNRRLLPNGRPERQRRSVPAAAGIFESLEPGRWNQPLGGSRGSDHGEVLMRRLGIVLLIVGLAGFLVATSQRASYDSLEGQFKA